MLEPSIAPKCLNVAGSSLTGSSPIDSFWSYLGEQFEEPNRSICASISSILKEEELCMTVDCMLGMGYDQLARIVCRKITVAGERVSGKASWIRSIERMWDHQFNRVSGTAPPSAVYGFSFGSQQDMPPLETPEPVSEWEQLLIESARMRLGQKLQRSRTLATIIVLPESALLPPSYALSS